MKILTTKNQNQLLKRIIACQIMIDNTKDINIKIYSKLTEQFSEISYEIGGVKGLHKVRNTIFRYKEVKK